MKQTPTPAASKFGAEGVGGNPKIYPLSSVTTHWLLVPLALSKVSAPFGILSACPSTVKVNGPPVIDPP